MNKDALEGDTIRLDCRFNPQLLDLNTAKLIFYWHRKNHQKTDPVAINENPLESDYQIEYNKNEGKYDLVIQKAQYDRDNGQFECKIKEAGNGAEVKSRIYMVTILSKSFRVRGEKVNHLTNAIVTVGPGSPVITPSNPIAKEGEPFHLSCSSDGGSPDPIIQWYRDGSVIEGKVTNGGTRSKPTTNTLTINPTLDHDKAVYKCTVWNRAMREEHKLESFVSLTVHCEFNDCFVRFMV